jgi:hypothetical protein
MKDALWLDNEDPALIDLARGAPYPEGETVADNGNEADDAPIPETGFSAENIPSDDLEAYFYIVKHLIMNSKESGEPYKYLAELYPRLTCFERDQPFIDYCRRVGE